MPEDYVVDQSPRTQRLIPNNLTFSGMTVISGAMGNIFNPDLTSFYELSSVGDDPDNYYSRLNLDRLWVSAGFFADIQLKSSSNTLTVYAKFQASADDITYINIGSTVSTTSTSYVTKELSGWYWTEFKFVKICLWTSNFGDLGYIKIRNVEITPNVVMGATEQFPPALTINNNFKVAINEAIAAGTNLIGNVKISDGTETATITADGYLDVKTHSSDKCFHTDYAAAQAAVVIITPTAGTKIKIVQVYVSTEDDGTDVTLAFGTSGDIFFKLYSSRKSAQTGNEICAEGAVNETIKLTCGPKTFVSVAYDEL